MGQTIGERASKIDWKELKPGDSIVVSRWLSINSVTQDAEFIHGDERCLVIAITHSKVDCYVDLRVWILSHHGVGAIDVHNYEINNIDFIRNKSNSSSIHPIIATANASVMSPIVHIDLDGKTTG